jgi:hypothetical protein
MDGCSDEVLLLLGAGGLAQLAIFLVLGLNIKDLPGVLLFYEI